MIARGGYSNDYDLRGEGILMITKGYSNDNDGMVL